MEGYRFWDGQGTFALEQPENYSYQYFPIAGKRFRVTVKNPDRLECGVYGTRAAAMDGQPLVLSQEDVRVILSRTEIEKLSDEVHEIEIWLGKGEERQR